LVFVAALFAAGAIAYGGGDGDLWWQRQLGDAILRTHALPSTLGAATFSAPDAEWIPHEWIFSTLWALANHLGARAFFAIGCAGVAVCALIVETLRMPDASPRARTFTLILIAGGLMPSFGLRAQILAWPLLALVMLALEAGPRRAWFALPVTIVWYNLHASALMVPCIIIVHGIGRAIDRRRPDALVGALALAGACTLASLATPFGSALPRFVIAWSSNPATNLIYEWAAVAPDKVLIVAGVLVIAAVIVGGEFRGARLSWSQRLVGLALFGATMLHIRNLGPFCIVAGPWAARALMVLMPQIAAAPWRGWRSDGGLVATAFGAALAIVVMRAILPTDMGLAAPAIARLAALHAPLRVACEDFSWCSRFAADPQVRVLIDGRTDAYPATVFADYRRMLRGDALPIFARWNIDAAVVHAQGPLAKTLRAAGWRLLRSREPQVYLRPGASGQRQRAVLVRPRGVLAREVG
jgi:hypothetical protein